MKVLIIAFWVFELLALVAYIRSCWPERTRKSFYLKLLVAGIYLAYGVTLAVLIRSGINVSFAGINEGGELSAGANTFLEFTGGGRTDRVVQLIVAALAYGWIGDFFLGLAHQFEKAPSDEQKNTALLEQLADKKTAANTLGVLAFILGHGLYCVGFGRALYGYEFGLRWWSLILFLLPVLAYLRFGIKLGLGKHLVPLGIYFVAVSAMFGLSTTLGIQLWPVHKPFSLCLMLGSLLFTLSDLGLCLETFGGEKFKKFAWRASRQVAYFFGQMNLATTILYFYTV